MILKNNLKIFFESKADEYGANKQFFVNKSDYLLNFQNFNKYLDQHEIYKISELDLYSRKANSFSEETIIPKEKNKILKILNNKSDIIILCYDSKVNELKFKKITNGLSRISKKLVIFLRKV